MIDSRIVKDMAEAIRKPTASTEPFDTEAEVMRIEGSIAWVHIPGGVDETPVDMTINAKVGDKVRVRVSGGQAWLSGNDTAPPTDDTKAKEAEGKADEANKRAHTATESAEQAAQAAEAAQKFANTAQTSANNASEYAARALGNLSTVQSVVETLAWITQHGTMTLTTDTEPDPTHVYFVVDANGDYIVGSTHYSVVTEPKAADMASYYVLSIDESLNNYVATHLALTNEGLWILPASTGYKVLIATGAGTTYTTAGTYIIDENGQIIASFGTNTQIGDEDNSHLLLNTDSILAYDGQGNPFFGVDMKGANISIKKTANFMYVYQPTGEDYQWQCKIHQNTYTVVLIESMVLKNALSGSEIAWPNKALMILPPPSQYDRIYFLLNDITYSGDFEEISFAVDGLFFNIVPGTTTAGTSFTKTGNFYIPFSNTLGGDKVNGIYLIISLTYNASTNTITYQASAKLETAVTPNPGVQFRINTYNLAISWTQQTHAPAYFLGTVSGDLGVYSTAIGDNIYASSDRQLAFGKYNIQDENDEYVLIAGNGTADNSRSNAFGVTWDGDMHLYFDTSAASGTIDGDLYAAITGLGWESEVII